VLKDYLFVSCDIIAHSSEPSFEIQKQRISDINALVARVLKRFPAPTSGVVWASGGDGGHVAFPIDSSPRLVLEFVISLREWSLGSLVPLRISANHGSVACIEGADGRPQLVGYGINLAGQLVPLGGQSRVIVTREFCEAVRGVTLEQEVFHDERAIKPKSLPEQQLYLLSVKPLFQSTWNEVSNASDRMHLQSASKRADALGVIYAARRLMEVNVSDPEAEEALRELALRKVRVASGDSLISDLLINEQLGPEVIRAGSLVERRAGETLCEFGDEGETMFLILKGQVGVIIPNTESPSVSEQIELKSTMRAGELAGELAFALRRRRTATLRCLGDSAFLAFSYAELLNRFPDLALRRQLEEILNRKILLRIVENVWNNAPYFRREGELAVSSKSAAPWVALAASSSLTTVAWTDGVIGPAHPVFAPGSLCVLLGGRVLPSGSSESGILDSGHYPILSADLSGDLRYAANQYQLLEDIKVLRIGCEGLRRLGSATYRELIRRIGSVLEASSDQSSPTTQPRSSSFTAAKKHVFLSYCRDDAAEVAELRDHLIAGGECIWWDQDIKPG
jgi:CRP-like cAMP-binding protein